MPEAEETIVHNLIDALEQLRQDLDKVELWAVALGYFQSPPPAYEPRDQYILRASSRATSQSSLQGTPRSGL